MEAGQSVALRRFALGLATSYTIWNALSITENKNTYCRYMYATYRYKTYKEHNYTHGDSQTTNEWCLEIICWCSK